MEEKRGPIKFIDSYEPQNTCELEDVLNQMVDTFTGANLVEVRFILVLEIRNRERKEKCKNNG